MSRLAPALGILSALLAASGVVAEPTLKRATRSSVDVTLPAVSLIREDGKTVALAAELGDGRPVVLTFIFTKCGTICPVMSQTFSRLQARFAEGRDRVHLVSISIDPEYDTPARLAEYAVRQAAGPQWHFYTGSVEATRTAQQAFQAYRGDKMSHTPVTFLRVGAGARWERIDGFASPDELLGELHHLIAAR